jgi:hypothetical protein
MASKMNQLRALDAEIVHHVIARGKMLEKRETLVMSLRGTPELEGYQAELTEWLESVKGESNG